MAWVEDRWMVTVANDDDSTTKVRSGRYGTGLRWRVRYETADARERSKSFARKPDADRFCTKVGADLMYGTYVDPAAGRITLRKYAEETWLPAQACDDSTMEITRCQLAHILEGLGGKRLDQLSETPSAVQAWLRGLKLAPSTKRHCLGILSSIFVAAIDDRRVSRNPCRARSLKLPEVPKRKVVPLEAAEREAVRGALPARYRAMVDAGAGCGLRQGEIFGLARDDIDFLRRRVNVRRQVKVVNGKTVLALPKRGKTRSAPLATATGEVFAEHIRVFRPREVTLPWHEPGTRRHGKPVTVELMFTSPWSDSALIRHGFNHRQWKPALRKAKVPVTRENGMHVLRHTYASLLLADGVDIKRVAEYLGHEDAGFTLRVYMHLMQGGEERARQAIDSAFAVPSPAPEGLKAR